MQKLTQASRPCFRGLTASPWARGAGVRACAPAGLRAGNSGSARQLLSLEGVSSTRQMSGTAANRRARRLAAVQPRAAAGAAAAQQYSAPGPFRAASLPTMNLPLGASPATGEPLTMQVEVLHPQGQRHSPLVILSPGFLLNSAMYRSYAQHLASWGYAVALYDLSELLDDTLTVVYMRQLADVCASNPQLGVLVDPRTLLLAGHSRGAKLSCLMAAQDVRVKGLLLLDPVDSSGAMGPSGPGYPSSLPALQQAAAARRVPTLVVGAALNSDIIPTESNWRRFVGAARAGGAPLWDIVLNGASHLQFCDKQIGLAALFTQSGPTPDAVVGAICRTAMTAWAQLAANPAPSTSYGDATTELTAVESLIRTMAPLSSQLSGLESLPAARGTGAGAGHAGNGAGAGASGGAQQHQQQARQQAGAPRYKPVTATYDQLMGRRVAELKRMLEERGISSAGCYEKSDLARLILEKCGA